MDEIFKVMTIDELKQFKDTYKNNAAIGVEIDKYIVIKEQEAIDLKEQQTFAKAVDIMVYGDGKKIQPLIHPKDISNFYVSWHVGVEVDDTSKPQEEVEIVDTKAVMGKDDKGNEKIVTPAVTHKEMRYPKMKVDKWVIEVNKGFQVSKDTTSAGTTTGNKANKRAITVKYLEGDKVVTVGNFSTASAACEYLKLPLGGDSGTRVLDRNNYLHYPYVGIDIIK